MSDTYITAIPAEQLFVDHHYQRDLDMPRAKRMANDWDRRMVGILDVADRGDTATPRYSVIDGQHRWAAAALLDDTPILVCNVHTGLTLEDEAELFDRLNRERRRITTWDHWHARKASGDRTVRAIEKTCAALKLRIDPAPRNGNIRCTATLEKLHSLGGNALIERTLHTVVEVWGRDVAGFDAPIVHGLGLLYHHLGGDIDSARLYHSLLDVLPQQLKAQALSLRQMTTGTTPKLVAIAVMSLYNKRAGRKILVSTRSFGATSSNAHSVKPAMAKASA